MWLAAAVASAFFAGVTSILAKLGIRKTDSDLATALRTGVVLIFSWLMVFVAGSAGSAGDIGGRSLLFLVLSGLATGASWMCYFKALSMADVNRVAPVDKSSTVLTVLLAILLFHETNALPVKLTGTALLAVGVLLMIERRETDGRNQRGWFLYAALSALFAALTSILAKVGISGVESNLGTAIRTCVVLVMAWAIVFLRGKQAGLRDLNRRELLFIVLSGLATGASWLCYYYAIQNGAVSAVAPIDKLSVVFTVAFSFFFLREKLSRRALLGLFLMASGTLMMAIWA